MQSLLLGSFAQETYNFKEPTNRSHPIALLQLRTGWRRLIGSLKLQIMVHKRAIKYRSLLRKMTHRDKGSYESSPPCTQRCAGANTGRQTDQQERKLSGFNQRLYSQTNNGLCFTKPKSECAPCRRSDACQKCWFRYSVMCACVCVCVCVCVQRSSREYIANVFVFCETQLWE